MCQEQRRVRELLHVHAHRTGDELLRMCSRHTHALSVDDLGDEALRDGEKVLEGRASLGRVAVLRILAPY